MTATTVDVQSYDRIAGLGRRVLEGGHITRAEGRWLFSLENTADIVDLLSWANRIRERFKGNKIHLCSIVNAKAGACSENCSFCAQSSFYQTGSPKYGFIEPEPVNEAADEANKNSVTAVGLVAAWKGLNEGPMLDEVCDRIRDLAQSGRPRGRLARDHGTRRSPIAKAAGLECPAARDLAPLLSQPVSTHTYDDRLGTFLPQKHQHQICSGGIIGMRNARDRCDLAFSLKKSAQTSCPSTSKSIRHAV
jgi:biotin synthase